MIVWRADNAVNGVPMCASSMINELRTKHNFKGYCTSDCEAVYDIIHKHNFTHSSGTTIRDVLEAGMDLDCGGYFNQWLQAALDAGTVPLADVQTAARRLLSVQMRLGMFDRDASQPFRRLGANEIDTGAHRALAKSAALQGIVLLANRGKALPLVASRLGKLALIGPNANATTALQSNYAGGSPFLTSPLEGISSQLPPHSVVYAKGCDISGTNRSGFNAAMSAAATADVIVLVVGLDGSQEGEANDRVSLRLPGVQELLIDAVLTASAGKPVVLVVISGGPVDLSAAKADSRIAAIVSAGYGGQAGGEALAEVLFGLHNPAGRLTTTWYSNDYTHKCRMADFDMRPNATSGCPGRGYRYFSGVPVFAFGSGMSYSSFSVAMELTSQQQVMDDVRHGRLAAGGSNESLAVVKVAVTNTGPLPGSYTAMVFTSPPADLLTPRRLTRQLRHFQGVHLAVNESATIEFHLTASDLSVVHEETGERRGLPGEWRVRLGAGGQAAATDEAAAVHVGASPRQKGTVTRLRVSNTPKKQLSKTLFGAFIEELNFVGDGGLFAELVRNGGFEAQGRGNLGELHYSACTSWKWAPPPWSGPPECLAHAQDFRPWTAEALCGRALAVSLDKTSHPYPSNPVSMRVELPASGAAACKGSVCLNNPGFWGISTRSGLSFNLSFWASVASSGPAVVHPSLICQGDAAAAAPAANSAPLQIRGPWRHYSVAMASTSACRAANLSLVLAAPSAATVVHIDAVSLMPDDAVAGVFRRDVYEAIKALRPTFLRYPGGSFLEGYSYKTRWQWKKSVGVCLGS